MTNPISQHEIRHWVQQSMPGKNKNKLKLNARKLTCLFKVWRKREKRDLYGGSGRISSSSSAPTSTSTSTSNQMNQDSAHDVFDFDGNKYESFSSINVRATLEAKNRRNGSLTKDADSKPALMDMLYQRNVGKIRNPYKLCKTREKYSQRCEWQQRSKRSIPFQVLRTPPTDAVLALDSTGSYMLAVGDGRRSLSSLPRANSRKARLSPAISLRLYG